MQEDEGSKICGLTGVKERQVSDLGVLTFENMLVRQVDP